MRNTKLPGPARAVRTLLLPIFLTGGAGALSLAFTRQEAVGQEPKTPQLCGRWHRGAGETTALDLAAVRRSYAGLATMLDQALAKRPGELPELLSRPHRSSLPSCSGRTTRSVKLKAEIGSRLAGAHFYFGWLGNPERFLLPGAVGEDPRASVFLLACERLSDAGELSRRLGRPVHLAVDEFARSLGVSCAGSRARVSPGGDEVEIHEGE